MLDEESVRQLSLADQQRLLEELLRLRAERAAQDGAAPRPLRWNVILLVILGCCLGLAAWIGILAVKLPPDFRTGSWRLAWVGYDVGLLAVFAATGVAAWRRRHVLVSTLVVLATLLTADAWFDVVLDAGSRAFWFSLADALVVELPLAVLAALTARKLLRLSIGRVMRYEGLAGRVPPLWRVPLLGTDGPSLRTLLRTQAGGLDHGVGPADFAEPAAAGLPAAGAGLADGAQGTSQIGVAELEAGVE